MYYDEIKAENKIITSDDLTQIFQMMGEILKKYQKVSDREKQENDGLESRYQNYTFKDCGSKMKVTIDFYDNTEVTIDNYENFMGIFYSRLEQIKTMSVYYVLSYEVITPEPNKSRELYSQSIQLWISEKKLDITLNLKSQDPKLDDLYNFIKNKVVNAPEKYDEVIRDRKRITNIVSLSAGILPGTIITLLFLFVPYINKIFLKGIFVYPMIAILIAYVIGGMISSSKLSKYYDSIVPNQKFAGFESNSFEKKYEDDIDDFINTSEILIGKKVKNMDNRKVIMNVYKKYKENILNKIIVLLVISVIIALIGLFI